MAPDLFIEFLCSSIIDVLVLFLSASSYWLRGRLSTPALWLAF